MKTCPACRRTYEDDGLNFCLEDGAVLNLSAGSAPTVVMGKPGPTDRAPREYGARMGAAVPNAPAYSLQAKKRSSKTWVWVLGIFGILILICGGGFAGFFFYLASVANTNSSFKGPPNSPTGRNSNGFTRASPSRSPAGTSAANEVDLSEWVEEPTKWLETEYADGEFFMTSKQSGYYYVLVAKKDEFSGASVARVTVRNAGDQAAELGYGLVFHSDMTPLTNDYAFLIDTKGKRYRVVRHDAEREKTITAWTASDLIKQGAEPNVLEARDKGEKIELYINGRLATSITNKQGPKGGVPGLYVGDGAKVGFRKLEVVK